MNDPSLDRTLSPSPPMGAPRFRHVLGRLERTTLRSGLVGLGIAAAIGMALGHDLMPGTAVGPFKMLAVGLALFGVAQIVRWTAYHRMVEIHDHFALPRSPTAAARPSGAWETRPRPFALGGSNEVRWFGSTSDAQQRGWHFFEEHAVFAGAPVARFAEQAGHWHEYLGLADPDPEGLMPEPPEDTVRFGRLLYRRLPSPPEGVGAP